MKNKKYDFSGYATRANVKCSDGRIINKNAFKHHDGQTVPLVFQHIHNDPNNVLGHALLEAREDGIYCYGTFNDTEAGKNSKILVQHGDITSLSIHANKLKQKGSEVLHGIIREVSLVLSGANIGAFIDNIEFSHSDGSNEVDPTEAIIYSGEEFSTEDIEHSDEKEETVKDVFETLNEKQKEVVYAMIAHAVDESAEEDEKKDDKKDEEIKQSSDSDKEVINHSKGGKEMKNNVFETNQNGIKEGATLTHADMVSIFAEAKRCGSLKDAVLSHAGTYGIDNIDYLFPDAQNVNNTPTFIKRDMEWVDAVVKGTRHSPFARIKSLAADITADEARAKGYVTGSEKKEEVFALLKRETYPTTVYKKQKLDRDDLIDITDVEVVAWLKAEMRMMLDEEIARAVLIGDGRESYDADKINESNIRPIYKDDNMYAHHIKVAADKDTEEIMDSIIRARKHYKGSGNPKLFASTDFIIDALLIRDSMGRRLYNNEADLAATLKVSKIVDVPLMEGVERTVNGEVLELKAIMVNPTDYVMGANKGGKIGMFDDFDIDYNQYKYLMETRCSGALVQPKSAIVVEQVKAEG
jgi:HK97 family phage prohead protease